MTRDKIPEQALTLSEADQAWLAEMLEESLSAGSLLTSAAEEKWSSELDRRIEAYDCGETQSLDVDRAVENLKRKIAQHRDQRSQL